MKKLLAMVLVLVMVLAVGCQSTPKVAPVTTEPTQPAAPVEKVTVKFAVQADSTDALNQLVKAYNDSSDKYQVEAVVMTNDSGNMHDQLINSLSSKSGEYDVISMDVVWAGEFAAAGYLEPIDTLIKDNGWLPTDFNAGSMASGKYKGKNYVLPYFSDLGFLFFRKDILSAEDAKKLEEGGYTWAELLKMAEGYMGQKGTKYGHVYQSKQYEGLTCNLNEFTANWSDIKGGLETMAKFVKSKATPEDILAYTEGETHNAFLNGEAVFARNWPYMNGMAASGEYNVKAEQVGFAPLPTGSTVGGWILGVNANSTKMDGAKDFLSFIAGPKGQKINATVGSYMPGFNALLADSDVLAANALLTNTGFQNALKATIARPVVANYSEVSDVIQIKAHEFLSGNGKLEDAVKAIEEKLK
ncbi:MAG: transporter substrate-binding protein [Clostridia bacterium]|jgi:multiple sugar transport system substrate-binding protein|nr:transporter substrate-binding protein [Clostridia bacterium]